MFLSLYPIVCALKKAVKNSQFSKIILSKPGKILIVPGEGGSSSDKIKGIKRFQSRGRPTFVISALP